MAEPVETEAAMKMPQYGQSVAGEWPTWLSDGEESSSDVGDATVIFRGDLPELN
ncbi:RidA family protein [Sesbania bispinosa]|nr:RidA family protein [Sesbania bispinosa]